MQVEYRRMRDRGRDIYLQLQSHLFIEKIQVFTGTRVMGSYLVDEKKAILLNVTGVTMAPQECGNVKLLSTNYPELFAAELSDVVSWGTLHPADLHVTIQERVREDYQAYNLEKRMQSVQEMILTTVCQQQVAGSEEIPQRLPNGHFAYRRGDVLFALSCVQKEERLQNYPTVMTRSR